MGAQEELHRDPGLIGDARQVGGAGGESAVADGIQLFVLQRAALGRSFDCESPDSIGDCLRAAGSGFGATPTASGLAFTLSCSAHNALWTTSITAVGAAFVTACPNAAS
ncbi:hypothetical protein [Streptomyces sp. NPDC058268]|uniref:hypothetical protein n=1 Tax=Streptomyces sp. NPDC058268 TaxID=3346413 RepID=UPI0036EAE89B